ncbi:MAG: UDP-2,4-diacetamido-2,4,6-trideoxy-beta-L-altropyranose hydrolase [Alphaproteobacteria bacterium]|nr:UDP-2,4-diacetamido-2,4,6-trideoxy-beta-L-altropyranose hydrolase [Alphaproteobacteria bacterium]
MTRPKQALFRCDASAQLGGGHVMRCLALADHMTARGWRCVFASSYDLATLVPALARAGHRFLRLPSPLDLVPQTWELVVVDSPESSYSLEQIWRKSADVLLSFEDIPSPRHECDILINQNLGQESSYEGAALAPNVRLLLGPSFALLRAEFSNMRSTALARRKDDPARHLLLSLGLMDGDNITGWVLECLEFIDQPLEIDVVLGSQAPHLAAVRRQAKTSKHRIVIHVDSNDMGKLMVKADLAIGAGGITSWERCCLGLPSLILLLAENQRSNAQELDRMGAALNLGALTTLGRDKLALEATRLLGDARARLAMSVRAAAVCDGMGARRVVQVIEDAR